MSQRLASTQRAPAGARERRRRAQALRRHRTEEGALEIAAASGELAQLRLAARLTARLTGTNDIREMAQLRELAGAQLDARVVQALLEELGAD